MEIELHGEQNPLPPKFNAMTPLSICHCCHLIVQQVIGLPKNLMRNSTPVYKQQLCLQSYSSIVLCFHTWPYCKCPCLLHKQVLQSDRKKNDKSCHQNSDSSTVPIIIFSSPPQDPLLRTRKDLVICLYCQRQKMYYQNNKTIGLGLFYDIWLQLFFDQTIILPSTYIHNYLIVINPFDHHIRV